MPGSTNFIQWNPNGVNQEDDAAYAADSLRSAGAPTNAIYPSPTANKSFFQWSTFIAAFASMLATKGYSPNDGSTNPPTSVNNLAAVLANVMTQADMSPWALLASPIFTGNPQAPTPAPGDNDSSIATTAFIMAALGALFQASVGVNGYVKIVPLGLIIQWGTSNPFPTGGPIEQVAGTFPIAFPTGVFGMLATMDNHVDTAATWAFVTADVQSSTNFLLTASTGVPTSHILENRHAHWIAIGF